MAQSRNTPSPGDRGGVANNRRKSPKRKVGCLGAALYFVFVVGAAALLAGLVWIAADDVLALTRDNFSASITVEEEDSISDIAAKLKDAEIINHPFLFRLYSSFAKADEKIDPGTYEVNATMDFRMLVTAMRNTSKYRSIVSVTIPEGYTQEQILRLLAEKEVNTYEALKEAADTYDYDYAFLEGVPFGENRLEGYLFPDTYEFYINHGAVSAIGKLLSTFNTRLTAEMREKAEKLGYSIHEVVTIASLIEKEAANNDEMPTISSVIHNRLNSSSLTKLQIDATIQYILPERKALLTYADLEIDSPYNTYMYEGLPPGPISCPGVAAIKAALNPESTGYYYYALTDEGVHEFSKTLAEHEAVQAANPGVYGGRSGND